MSGAHGALSDLVPLEEALARLSAGVRAVARREEVPLEACAGRVLAQPVTAREDAPAGDRSRMDGYAVSVADLGAPFPAVRRVQGRALADAALLAPLAAGMCYEVATGALLPPGADAVVPAEETAPAPQPGAVTFLAAPGRGAHISRRGSDYRAGDEIVPAGARLTPARAAAAAAAGHTRVTVVGRPRLLVVPTGDEVVPVEGPLPAGRVRDSNSYGLAALVAARGGAPDRHPVVGDDAAQVAQALAEVASYDAAVFSGGTSAGAKDHIAASLAKAGTVSFHGVRIRPGKPILFGQVQGVPVLGLPGNPTSCMVGAHLFLRPLVDSLLGAPPAQAPTVGAELAGDIEGYARASPPGFLTLALVSLAGGRATPVLKDSMSVTGSSAADGYVEVAPGAAPPRRGDRVPVVLFG